MHLFKVLIQERNEVRSIIVKASNESEAFYKLTPKQRTQVLGITKL